MTVYFLVCPNRVKIGFTARTLGSRVADFSTAIPDILSIWWKAGDEKHEADLHSLFSEYRLRGDREWFHLVPQLDRYIRSHAAEWACGEDAIEHVEPERPIPVLKKFQDPIEDCLDDEGVERLVRARALDPAPIAPDDLAEVRAIFNGCSSYSEVIFLFIGNKDPYWKGSPRRCPIHEDDGSRSWFIKPIGQDWSCSHGASGDCLDLLAAFLGCDIHKAAAIALAWLGYLRKT